MTDSDAVSASHFRSGPWIMHMCWSQLAFMHWPVPAGVLRPLVPSGLEIDTFEGQAWLAVVPFRMSNVRPRCLPGWPGHSAFPELNLRTYVTHGGHPGVWFITLDAASRVAVRLARRFWHLPYFDARMSMQVQNDRVHYQSTRTHKNAAAAGFTVGYRPVGPVYATMPGTLEHFLISRWSLYCADGVGRIYRGDIDHSPWPIQRAEAEIELNEMASQLGYALPKSPALVHYVEKLDVVAWMIRGA